MMEENKQHCSSKLCSSLYIFVPIILLVLVFSFFYSISNSFLFTIPIALVSTMFLVTLRKKKGSRNDQCLVQDKLQKDVTETELNQQYCESAEIHELQPEAETDYSFPSDSESSSLSAIDKNKTLELNVHEFRLPQAESQSDSSLPSDSESSTGSIMSVGFEIDHNGYQNVACFDNLASYTDDDTDGDDADVYDKKEEEEDGLIEINLPSRYFYDLTAEHEEKLESNLPDFLPESIFKQQGLMELLAEINDMNEDENLIEIDISMGSTNSTQDFRLKQELEYLGNDCVSE